MTELSIEVVAHDALTARNVGQLRRLFDDEYLHDFGEWDPDLPYGYAPHDRHVVARSGDSIVGHVGWARRTVGVGEAEAVIGGVGGVLASSRVRASVLVIG